MKLLFTFIFFLAMCLFLESVKVYPVGPPIRRQKQYLVPVLHPYYGMVYRKVSKSKADQLRKKMYRRPYMLYPYGQGGYGGYGGIYGSSGSPGLPGLPGR